MPGQESHKVRGGWDMTLEHACKRLVVTDPFWGLFLTGLRKRTDSRTGTCTVVREGMDVSLYVNPEFWNSLPEPQQRAVLLHELHHICFMHMFMGSDFPDSQRFNIAADLEVNGYISDLPESALLPGDYGFLSREGVAKYYRLLNGRSGTGKDTLDDHGTWKDFSDVSGPVRELVKSQISGGLKMAADTLGWGSVPGDVRRWLEGLLAPVPRVCDWRRAFRRLAGANVRTELVQTRQRESRRFPDAPGTRFGRNVSVLVALDTSGSIGSQELRDFFGEVRHIHRAGCRITVCECDMKLGAVWEYTGGSMPSSVTGGGGTSFLPAVEYYRQHRKEYNTMVYFTDGVGDVGSIHERNITWVITPNGRRQEYPGRVIYM